MGDPPFRVIIVGAGPVGLYIAHALQKAAIDFVVLEQHNTPLSSAGQVLFIWPQTVRLFDQVGLMGPLQDAALNLHRKKRTCGTTGRVLTSSNFWDNMRENHGYPFLPVLRRDVVRILYEHLEDGDSRIITNAQVVDIEAHDSSVHVKLKNGTIIKGSIVIGADGVHSQTRAFVQGRLNPKTTIPQAVDIMKSEFYGVFGQVSNADLQIEREVLFESRGAGTVIQCIATKENVHFVTLTPKPQQASYHDTTTSTTRYSKETMEAYATSISAVSVCPGITFGDIWKHTADKNETTPATTVLVNQEEGFLTRWWRDRVVLVGDAAHKMTSVNGLGMNCGVQSAAALANEIHQLQKRQTLASDYYSTSTQILGEAFTRYQRVREPECKVIWAQGYKTVRELTRRWSWVNWVWDVYVLPWVDIESFAKGVLVSLLLIRYGVMLSYVPFESRRGRIPWAQS